MHSVFPCLLQVSKICLTSNSAFFPHVNFHFMENAYMLGKFLMVFYTWYFMKNQSMYITPQGLSIMWCWHWEDRTRHRSSECCWSFHWRSCKDQEVSSEWGQRGSSGSEENSNIWRCVSRAWFFLGATSLEGEFSSVFQLFVYLSLEWCFSSRITFLFICVFGHFSVIPYAHHCITYLVAVFRAGISCK